MIEQIEEDIRNKFGLTESQMDIIKIFLMFGLIITMIVLAIVIFKYGSAIKYNPCDFCNCTKQILKGGLKI